MFFDHYPYTNFHNVNLDWVLQAVKSWGLTVEANNQAFKDLKAANESFKEYVTKYLKNLDVSDEINKKLDQMLEDGVLSPYMAPYIQTDVSAWLSQHITPTTPAVDSSLTISGAAADSATVGTSVRSIDGRLGQTLENSDNIFTISGSVHGIINASGAVSTYSSDPTLRTTDFIPIDADVKYCFLNTDLTGLSGYACQIIGFYTDNKTFISRLIRGQQDTQTFTTPSDAAFCRVTENITVGFPERLTLSKYGSIPYKRDMIINPAAMDDSDLVKVAQNSGRLMDVIDRIKTQYIINASNRWGMSSNDYVGYHVLIPVSEWDKVELAAQNSVPSVYALLTEKTCFSGDTPNFANQYIIEQIDDNDPVFVQVTDDQGNPVIDTRHVLQEKQRISFFVVPGAKYLYCTYKVKVSGKENITLPAITINGITLNQPMAERETANYSTIFFDDFDTFNSDVWERVVADPPQGGAYASRFYTTPDNSFTEQSCLVLKCAKGDSGNNGTYTDIDGNNHPNEYLAPYISSGLSYALPAGRISAKIKTSGSMTHKFFPWAFWTFGQNERWSYAHEMDIIEGILFYLERDTVIKGTTYYRGSVASTMSSHIHTMNTEGNDVNTSRYLNINYANNNNGVISDDVNYYNAINYDPSIWHVYAVEFDDKHINVFIDEELFCTFNATTIGAVDRDGHVGFFYPQDVRFNIKAFPSSEGEGYMFVDWVRIEALDKTPCLSISHDNVSITVGETIYINPTFNEGCTNTAFVMRASDPTIVNVMDAPVTTGNISHAITGLESGATTVTMTAANARTVGTFTVTVV